MTCNQYFYQNVVNVASEENMENVAGLIFAVLILLCCFTSSLHVCLTAKYSDLSCVLYSVRSHS